MCVCITICKAKTDNYKEMLQPPQQWETLIYLSQYLIEVEGKYQQRYLEDMTN